MNTHLVDLGQASTVSHLKKEKGQKNLLETHEKQMRLCCFSFLFLPFTQVSKTPSAPLTPLVSALIGDKQAISDAINLILSPPEVELWKIRSAEVGFIPGAGQRGPLLHYLGKLVTR